MRGTQESCTGGGGFQHVTNVPHTKCSYHSTELTQTDFRKTSPPKTPFSHTKPNKDKWIYFIFQMRPLLGSLLYEPETYTASEAAVGRAIGGACQIEAPVFQARLITDSRA